MKDFKPKAKKINSGCWIIFPELCKGCGICLIKCPKKALVFGEEQGVYNTPTSEVKEDLCNLCGICELFCPDNALKVKKNG